MKPGDGTWAKLYSLQVKLAASLVSPLPMYFACLGQAQRGRVMVIFGLLFSQSRSVPMILLTGAGLTLCANWLVAIFHPYAAELFPTRIRAQAVGFTFSWSRVSSMVVGYAVTLLLSWYGPDGVFTMIALAMVAIILSVSVLGPRSPVIRAVTTAR